jgi:hypothetical protein
MVVQTVIFSACMTGWRTRNILGMVFWNILTAVIFVRDIMQLKNILKY